MMPRACVLCAALAVALAGCGGGSYKTVPVSGRVTLDNKPLANAIITFVPEAATGVNDPTPSSVGITGEDGTYSLALNTDGKTKGAVVGKHKIIIVVGSGTSTEATRTFHKQLPQRYNRNTELTCDVPGGGRSDANFDLKSR
jgi:hypothetical protein